MNKTQTNNGAPTGSMDSHGRVILTYHPANGYKLLSPDGKLHLIPCENCHRPQWVELNVVSIGECDCKTYTGMCRVAEEMGATVHGGIGWTWAHKFHSREAATQFVAMLDKAHLEHRGVYGSEDGTASVRFR